MAPFGNFGDRHDEDVPSGEFVSSGWIGHAVTKRTWDLGWNGNEGYEDSEGHKLPKGRIYRDGTKPDAEAYLKTNSFNNNKFVNSVLVTTMALDSVCNLTQEQKDKFKYPIQVAVPVTGLGKDYKDTKFVGLVLITVPSMVDAYARMSGWYKDSLFNLGMFPSSLERTPDASELIERLVAQRTAIWYALAEGNWKANVKESKSVKLQEALSATTLKDWRQFCKLHSVFDPSHGSGYTHDEIDPVTQETVKAFTRNRVQIISEFYVGEREAVAAGKAEIEAKGGAQSPNGTTASVYAQLSEKTRKNYDQPTWEATVDEIRAALKAGSKPKSDLLKMYSVTMPDLALLE